MLTSQMAMRPCPQCGNPGDDDAQYCAACGFPVGSVPAETEDSFIGKTLPGGFLILDLLSVGGMGRVYRAEQRVLGRTVAVKIIHPHLLSDENSAARFLTEARAASQLNHPNSVSVIDFGRTQDGEPYLVMEFLRGKDLAYVAYEEGPLPFNRICEILRQVLTALGEAHELGIVHRDLKPENIIVERMRRGNDHVKVVDFGLAKLKASEVGPSVTSPGIVCGTPDYMAPEQGRGDPIDGRADLYAVGVVMFQLLTGRLPFESENPTQVVMMHISVPVPDARQVAPEREIPPPIIEVLNKALAKDAKDRYQDAHEFADALVAAVEAIESVPPDRGSTMPPVSLPDATILCSACGTVVPMAKFCGECGAKLPLRSIVPTAVAAPKLPLQFVGRDDDIAWLEDRRVQARKGRLIGARLVGEPGSGKTRLLTEFLNLSSADGDLIARVGPDPYYAEVAYYAVRDAIAQLADLGTGEKAHHHWDSASPDTRQALMEIFRGSSLKDDKRTPDERRYALAEALRWALGRAEQRAAGGRVILAIDELHRVDGASRAAFADAVGEPAEGCGAMIVAAHAPGFEAGWSSDHAARVLSGLPPPTVARLLKAGRPGERLYAATDSGARGVLPLYVEHAVRFTMEGGTDPPARLGDLIVERIDGLDSDGRRVLQATAVLGDSAKPSAIGDLVPDSVDVEDTFDALDQAGMVVRQDGSVGCSHPLLREIVLAAIPAAVRRELHTKVVRVYEKEAAPIEARALHSFYSQDAFEALLLLEQVSDRGVARGDLPASILALRRGLELARQEIARGELDDPLRAVLIFSRKLGDALTRAGNFSDAEGVLREALDIAGPSGTDRARVLESLAHVAHGRSRTDEAVAYIDEAIEVALRSGAHELQSTLEGTRQAWAS